MDFLQNVMHMYQGHDFYFRSYILHHRSLYPKMQCVRTVNMPCSSTVIKSFDGFSYVLHFRYPVDDGRWCNDNYHTPHVRSR